MALARAAWICLILPQPVSTSWRPAPLSRYGNSDADGSETREFRHHEEHKFEDGGRASLHWQVRVNPRELLSLDAERHDGAHIVQCSSDSLLIQLPQHRAASLLDYRYVVASELLHNCEHLHGDHLYRRVLDIGSPEQHSERGFLVTFHTSELASAAHVLPEASFFFRYDPPGSNSIDPRRLQTNNALAAERTTGHTQLPRRTTAEAPRYSMNAWPYVDKVATLHASANDKVHTGTQSLLNFIPQEAGKFGWNWDFERNRIKNDKVKVEFPGGEGYALFEKTYIRAYATLTFNFTSHNKGVGLPPHVFVAARLDGHSYLNGEISGILDTDRGVHDIHSPELPSWMQKDLSDTVDMSPLEFYLGTVPIRLDPGIRIGISAFHKGKFRGSMRMGLSTQAHFKAAIDFDSVTGLKTSFTTDVANVQMTPPTWLVWTRNFQMGALLDAAFWVTGCFGDVKDMKLELDVRPYMNASVSQTAPGGGVDMNDLAVYPFRVVGLPKGEDFAVSVEANHRRIETSMQLSYGITEYSDPVDSFNFGLIPEEQLLMNPIKVNIIRGNGVIVASGSASCTALVRGECRPSPVTAKLTLDGAPVLVHLTVLWQSNPFETLASKIRSLRIVFPTITMSPYIAATLNLVAAPAENQNVTDTTRLPFLFINNSNATPHLEFRLMRNGRAYNAPMIVKESRSDSVLLTSDLSYELGRCFLDSWRSHRPSSSINPEHAALLTPRLELLVDGIIVGTSAMPAVPWDQGKRVFHKKSFSELITGKVDRNENGVIPIDFSLKSSSLELGEGASGGRHAIGTGKMQFVVEPASKAAFWLQPSQSMSIGCSASGCQVQLLWTVGSQHDELTKFTLWIMKVRRDGSFDSAPANRNMLVFSQKCAHLDVDLSSVRAYHSVRHSCLHNLTVTNPVLEVDRIVFLLQWTRDGRGSVMVSAPVSFMGEPGAALRVPPTAAGPRRLGWDFEVRHTDVDFDRKVMEMSPPCLKEPLKYSFGIAAFVQEKVLHVRLPKGLGFDLGATPRLSMETPDYISGWLPLSGSDDAQLEMFPAGYCLDGQCNFKGTLPGCRSAHNTSGQKSTHIQFTLSRPIPWSSTTPMEIRNIIAYGLAVLPEAIQLKAMDIDKSWWQWPTPLNERKDCSRIVCPDVMCLDGSKPPVTPTKCCGDKLLCPRVSAPAFDEKDATLAPTPTPTDATPSPTKACYVEQRQHADKKCPYKSSVRTFAASGKTTEECAARCQAQLECRYFSRQSDGWCAGCMVVPSETTSSPAITYDMSGCTPARTDTTLTPADATPSPTDAALTSAECFDDADWTDKDDHDCAFYKDAIASGYGSYSQTVVCNYDSGRAKQYCRHTCGTCEVCSYSEEACRHAAAAQFFALGGHGNSFAGDYNDTGCYYYESGPYTGIAFYGYLAGGAEVEAESQLTALSPPKKRLHGTHKCEAQPEGTDATPLPTDATRSSTQAACPEDCQSPACMDGGPLNGGIPLLDGRCYDSCSQKISGVRYCGQSAFPEYSKGDTVNCSGCQEDFWIEDAVNCSHVACAHVVCLDGLDAPVPAGECCGDAGYCPGENGSVAASASDEDDAAAVNAMMKLRPSVRDSAGSDEDDWFASETDGGPLTEESSIDHPHGKRRLRVSRSDSASGGREVKHLHVEVAGGALPYLVDDTLLRELLAQQAWRGMSDGREAELGPVEVLRVSLLEQSRLGGHAPQAPLHEESPAWHTLTPQTLTLAMVVVAVGVILGVVAHVGCRGGRGGSYAKVASERDSS